MPATGEPVRVSRGHFHFGDPRALLLIARQTVLTSLFAVLVAGGGAFALLLYHYVDVGKIGRVMVIYDNTTKSHGVWSVAGVGTGD